MKLNRRNTILLIVIIIFLIFGIKLFNIYTDALTQYVGPTTRVYVISENGPNGLRDSLKSTLGEEIGEKVWKTWDRISKNQKVYTGSYLITEDDRAWNIANKLQNGQQDPIRITFNNLRTIDQLAERISAQFTFSAENFLSATDTILSAKGVSKANYPAHFLPDTYEFYWSASPNQVVNKLVRQYDIFWSESRIDKAKQIGLTPEEVSTLASIVEEETSKSDERGKVARLYLNRLKRGMLLQADPTVKFAVGDFSLRRILNQHLKTISPYNTYLNPGLPPGPIRIPSATTLDAVLYAPKHNYIYMCAKEDFSGYHNFATDLATHNANAARYHRELNKRKIK